MSADSELAQDLRALKEHNKQQKRARLAQSLKLFAQEGIPFSSNDGGVHCVFQAGFRTYDVWPSTNRWRLRGGIKSFFGMQAFINEYRKHAAVSQDFSKIEERVLAHQLSDQAFVERMERAYPHLKGEEP